MNSDEKPANCLKCPLYSGDPFYECRVEGRVFLLRESCRPGWCPLDTKPNAIARFTNSAVGQQVAR